MYTIYTNNDSLSGDMGCLLILSITMYIFNFMLLLLFSMKVIYFTISKIED